MVNHLHSAINTMFDSQADCSLIAVVLCGHMQQAEERVVQMPHPFPRKANLPFQTAMQECHAVLLLWGLSLV